MDQTTEEQLAEVSETAKQAREAEERRQRWSWVEPAVWTDRMLASLETGVKGGQWYSLMDKVYSLNHLRQAFARVKANGGAAGVDQVTISKFEDREEKNLEQLARSLRDSSYRPQALRRVWIPKPGSQQKRPLGIPTVRDRIAQTAVRAVLEPIFERDFAAHSYGFRPNRGCKDALRRVEQLLKQGYTWVVDADLKNYFDSIPQEPLQRMVAKKVSDGRVLELVAMFLRQGVLEECQYWTPETGTPQGAVISPLLANIYLHPLDQLMEQAGIEMVRYADDFVLLCRSQEQAQAALEQVRAWTVTAGLQLHPDKTRVVDATQPSGFDFLGYHFERGMRWPRRKSLDKFKHLVRQHTRRRNGHSLQVIIANLNRSLQGWLAYYQHSHRTTFPPLDQWIRMRLRSILRRRQGRRGRGRGWDHHRWPNAFFQKQGLLSLCAAHASLRQSSSR